MFDDPVLYLLVLVNALGLYIFTSVLMAPVFMKLRGWIYRTVSKYEDPHGDA